MASTEVRAAVAAGGNTVTITANDMKELNKKTLALIQKHEDLMQQRFDRIKKLHPSRVLPDGDIDADVERRIRSLAKAMYKNLNKILKLLASRGKTSRITMSYIVCHQLSSGRSPTTEFNLC